MSSPLTTHVLDTSLGKPAKGVPIKLEFFKNQKWILLSSKVTNADGRVPDLTDEKTPFPKGTYRITFSTGEYAKSAWGKEPGFYPEVPVVFQILKPKEHYHVPLLISPFGYSTYRGS